MYATIFLCLQNVVDEFEFPELTSAVTDGIKEHMSVVWTIREKAALKSQKVGQQMVASYVSKNTPSIYEVGDKVLVQVENRAKCNKIKGKGVSVQTSYPGIVVDCNSDINKYKVSVEVEGKKIVEWINVSKMSSMTRGEENRREKQRRKSKKLSKIMKVARALA